MADHESSVIDHKNHMLLDQPLLRLPYELLRKNFRSAHLVVEKDSKGVKDLLRDSATSSLNGRSTPQDVVRDLDSMIARMRGIKRKLTAHADEESRLCRQSAARIRHLAELHTMQTLEDVRYEAWSRRRLDRLLVDYMLRKGYVDSASQLARERDMEDLVDIDAFVQMIRIREALRNGSVQEALAWCQENKKELRKMDSNLEFMLRFQQYIELVRAARSERRLALEAIAHAKKYLLPFKDAHASHMKQAGGLLAFPPDATLPPAYAALYDPARWNMLADLFTRTHHDLLALPPIPLLHVSLSAGLSALKTPACHSAQPPPVPLAASVKSTGASTVGARPAGAAAESSSGATTGAAASTGPQAAGGISSATTGAAAGTSSENVTQAQAPPADATLVTCPICSTELNELARSVQYAHHSKSHVDGDLVLLPSGRVYGRAKLDAHAAKHGLDPEVMVKDIRTGEIVPVEWLKKVYIT